MENLLFLSYLVQIIYLKKRKKKSLPEGGIMQNSNKLTCKRVKVCS